MLISDPPCEKVGMGEFGLDVREQVDSVVRLGITGIGYVREDGPVNLFYSNNVSERKRNGIDSLLEAVSDIVTCYCPV